MEKRETSGHLDPVSPFFIHLDAETNASAEFRENAPTQFYLEMDELPRSDLESGKPQSLWIETEDPQQSETISTNSLYLMPEECAQLHRADLFFSDISTNDNQDIRSEIPLGKPSHLASNEENVSQNERGDQQHQSEADKRSEYNIDYESLCRGQALINQWPQPEHIMNREPSK